MSAADVTTASRLLDLIGGLVADSPHGGGIAGLARLVRSLDVDVVCLGRTKAGHPRHPLYLPGDTRPNAWEVSA